MQHPPFSLDEVFEQLSRLPPALELINRNRVDSDEDRENSDRKDCHQGART